MSVETYGAHECRTYFVAETQYGITPASPAMLGINTEGVEPKISPGLIKVMGLGSRDLQALYAGVRKVNLKFPNALSGQSPISLIQHVQTLSSLSVQVIYYKGLWSSPSNIIAYLLSGCKIDKLSVECHLEDIVKGTVEMMGQTVVRQTGLIQNATYGDYSGAIPFSSTYVQKGAPSGGSGVTLTDVTDWKFDIENNLKPVAVIQSGGSGLLLKYLRERHRKLEGELTMEFENDSELQDMLIDTEFSLLFGLGSTNTALFKYCKWEEVNTPTKMEDLVTVKAKFVARDLFIS
jgi:hypothetical protein